MTDYDRSINALHSDMAHILNDAERFLSDLKGQKKVKGIVKKDVRLLRDHLSRLVTHLEDLETLKLDA